MNHRTRRPRYRIFRVPYHQRAYADRQHWNELAGFAAPFYQERSTREIVVGHTLTGAVLIAILFAILVADHVLLPNVR